MIYEHAWVHVTQGEESAFEQSMTEALNIITAAPGCHGAHVHRQIEDDQQYLLIVEWESVETHMEFRASEAFQAWRAMTHHFYDTAPSVTHFSTAFAQR